MEEDDQAIAASLEDALVDELDRQYMDGELEYYSSLSGIVDGVPNLRKAILAVLQAYWEEYGR